MSDTTRLGLRAPEGADDFLPSSDIAHNAEVLDDAAIDLTGTMASRPAASDVERGTYYFANDTFVYARSDGTNWHVISDPSQVGLNDGVSVRRGKSIIPGSESRTNTAYGLLATPDRVSGIVLPTDGLIVVSYQAMWEESVSGAAQAAIFLDGDQLKVQHDEASGSGEQSARNGSTAGSDQVLATAAGYGLVGSKQSAFNRPANWTTGQVLGITTRVAGGIAYRAGSNDNREVDGPIGVGGPVEIFAAAGTYDISVQFKSSSGSVTAWDRRLWVRTEAY